MAFERTGDGKQLGRPRINQAQRMRSTPCSLDQITIDRAIAYGGGNMSAGIRAALARLQELGEIVETPSGGSAEA